MKNHKNFDPSFVHTVYFWFNNPQSDTDKKTFEASLKKFLNESKYAQTKFIGRAPNATRDVVDGSFTYSLILTFASSNDQKKYQDEPAHQLFVNECKNLWKKVIVYDSIPVVQPD